MRATTSRPGSPRRGADRKARAVVTDGPASGVSTRKGRKGGVEGDGGAGSVTDRTVHTADRDRRMAPRSLPHGTQGFSGVLPLGVR